MNENDQFRDYANAEAGVRRFYAQNHEYQTFEFAKAKRLEYGHLNRSKMGVWEACEFLENSKDESDPDTESSQIVHCLQTAEAIRADGHPEWFILAGLVHDLGKVLCLYGEPQWAVTGDTFVLGCGFRDSIVYPEYLQANEDVKVESYQSNLGIYEKNCGLENVTLSWGHDEYMYQVARDYLPVEALYMIRYHSFYPGHATESYADLFDDRDVEMFEWVRAFNEYDLYTKHDDLPDPEVLKPYYMALIEKYFPKKISW